MRIQVVWLYPFVLRTTFLHQGTPFNKQKVTDPPYNNSDPQSFSGLFNIKYSYQGGQIKFGNHIFLPSFTHMTPIIPSGLSALV